MAWVSDASSFGAASPLVAAAAALSGAGALSCTVTNALLRMHDHGSSGLVQTSATVDLGHPADVPASGHRGEGSPCPLPQTRPVRSGQLQVAVHHLPALPDLQP